jgi:heat shock protein beta
LKEDAEEYADYFKLNSMVHHYSEFITHPIYLRKTETVEVPDEDEEEDMDLVEDETKEEDELDVNEDEDEDDVPKEPKMKEVTTHTWEKSNADQALWYRSKDDISDDEYQDFYKMISKDSANATAWSHFDAEGNINFKSLVYIPTEIPPRLRSGDFSNVNNEIKLYVRKVLISDEFELLPRYLSFVKGVIDSDDLPLNVNRETLQESKIISIIKKKTTRKCIDMIKKLADGQKDDEDEEKEVEIDEDGNVIESEEETEDKPDEYITWYENFGPSLKMGIIEDDANRKKISKLIRFKTSKSDGEYTSFDKYIEGMKEWQSDIFFIAGIDEAELKKSPFMEKFFEKDVEGIYFTEPVDEYMVQSLQEFDGKKFSTITKETVNFGDEDEDLEKRIGAAYKDKYDPLIKFMTKFYGKAVFRAQISKRLGSVPAIVSSSEFGHSANMERIMRSQVYSHGRSEDTMRGLRTLEINPRHPIVDKVLSQLPESDDGEFTPEVLGTVSQEVKDTLWTLLDTALLNGGFPINEGKAFTKRMTRILQSQLELDTLELMPEIEPKVEVDPPEVELGDMDGLNLDDFADIDIDADLDEFDE